MIRQKILDILFDGEVTQKELTEKLKSSRSRVSEVLKELERERLIIRRRISQRTISVSINHDKTLRVGILKSSEYAFVVSTLNSMGKFLPYRIRVYDNSLEALKDLIVGQIDIAASPLVSGYYFHLIDRNVRAIAGIAIGGGGILKRKNEGLIGTTPLSKMDRNSRDFGNYSQVYYKSIEDILRAYSRREIDAAAIWEPFLSMHNGTRKGSDGICCCLFVHTKMGQSLNEFRKGYVDSVRTGLIGENRAKISELLSSAIGVERKWIEESLDSYHFTTTISWRDVEEQVSSFGLPLGKEVGDFVDQSAEVSL